ncbi:MAG: calcium/sodium antiporter [Victivallaceae bacterium]|nr:calcium/sodium antiporter [Victivallaceae bacterium]
MATTLQICNGLLGIVLLYYGAEFLVKGGVSIATRMKISPLVIGLTLVAFATSAPELVVSIDAALKGMGNISIGNVIGSNVCNIALILGLCALITPLRVNPKLFRFDVPLMISTVSLFSLFYYFAGGINRWHAITFLIGIIAYTTWSIYNARKEEQLNLPVISNCEKEIKAVKGYSVGVAILFMAGGLIALVGGAKIFVDSAVYIAQLLKVSDAVIGLTIVAIGTSLPELATSVVAALKNEKDIAVGNVIGSCIFNILAIMGIAPLFAPLSPLYAPGISFVDIGLMVFCAIILYPIMKSGFIISRKEGAFLLTIYIAYSVWLIAF